ncbi:MAG: formylglycine-generating enzyme family protein [Gemmataceae bacterium]|nr:formylglycine-generating enzyme family protein [Gemmataceae bacterium]
MAGDIITNSIGMKLAWIPPGKFIMGSPKNDPDRQDNEMQHTVELTKGFYMGVYPVTQEEYAKVMPLGPCCFCSTGGMRHKVAGMDTKRFPVEHVTWHEAFEFCRRLGGMEAKNYDLPTEAEWEYACRAGTSTAFKFDEELSSRQANFGNNLGRTSAVGSYPANAFGLFDMHGNVSEWCKDCFDSDFYSKSPKTNPECTSGGARVLRGGSWNYGAALCRESFRGLSRPQLARRPRLQYRFSCGVVLPRVRLTAR